MFNSMCKNYMVDETMITLQSARIHASQAQNLKGVRAVHWVEGGLGFFYIFILFFLEIDFKNSLISMILI